MSRTWNIDIVNKIGGEVQLYGWVHARRDMGKIIFIDLRDRTGIMQVVFAPKEVGGAYEFAKALRSEYVVSIIGTVQKRTEKTVNPKLPTGTVEILAADLKILNESKTPPFELDKDTRVVNEETRLKYRYLDLRSERMRGNLVLRHRVVKFCRDYLSEHDFTEIETPILTKGTPEGAREFLVPSRLHPGKFYVLPQSPQQFKQLLMVAGVERYFQIARALRDEDQRGDRQPEHTQLDIEMSFIEAEDVYELTEGLMIAMVGHLNQLVGDGLIPSRGGRLPGSPLHGIGPWHISKIPFPRISYSDAIEKYGSDKPDLRKDKNDPHELAFAWIVDFPLFEHSEEEGKLVATHHLFSAPRPQDIPLLDSAPEKAFANQYDLVANGYELASGSMRIHDPKLQQKIFHILQIPVEEAERRFGHMLEAFTYGAPPHGGIAPGIDRLVMLLAGEPNIREVIAFPKTGDARDPMMGAPSELPDKSLREAHIKVAE
ncbi:MAG: Aspartyl-tRNA synthetase [Parcubacteria group bacterium GW2011_GWC2_45_7]|nr:MAG: Aspartyl-tRNA synthetase [Parcubacteria group bacterium GW2011_GWC2_45_7]KKU73505.1 MAG: Aspartyl-tRNA synthetase [Parcubacteria group bacterium GW2011_GWA2_47_26]